MVEFLKGLFRIKGATVMLISETEVEQQDELTDSEKELLDLIISQIVKQILPWLQ